MNNKLLYGAAISALALSACSQDTLVDAPMNQDVISFGITNAASSRASESYCNTNLPQNFQVSSYFTSSGEKYFADQAAGKLNSAWVLETTFFWPKEALDFHAWKNDQGTYRYDETDKVGTFIGFEPKSDAASQLDLIYAVRNNQTKDNKTVKLNFRHALSQIVFNADNSTNMTIRISGVHVGHLNSKGDYAMCSENTENVYEYHETGTEPEDTHTGFGTWSNLSGNAEYATTFAAKEIGKDLVSLTSVKHTGGVDGSLLLIPQEQTAWDPSQKGDSFNGAYFLLDIEMLNASGVDMGYTQVAVPAQVNWKQGTRYIYTFHFTENGAGFNPDPNDPKPILVKIDTDIEVDDFLPGENIEPGMGGGNTPEPAKKYSYEVNYDANGGMGAMTPDALTDSENATWSTTAKANGFSRENYVFSGWNTKADGTGDAYAAGETIVLTGVENSTAEVTLYAQWDPDDVTISLVFDRQGGTGGQADASKTVKYGEEAEFTLDLTIIPAKQGYSFKGWSDTASGDVNPEYVNGYVIRTTTSKTLYAVWVDSSQVGGGGSGPSTGEVD